MSIAVNPDAGSFTLPGGETRYATLYVDGQLKDIHAIESQKDRCDLLRAVARTYQARRNKDTGELTITLPERDVAKVDQLTLPNARSATICKIMQTTFGIHPSKSLPNAPIEIPGIVNGGTNQCYANALIHILFDRWGQPLDKRIKELDANPAQQEQLNRSKKPLSRVFRELLAIRRLYTQNSEPIPENKVSAFIRAMNELRGKTESRNGEDPCDLLSPLIQAVEPHSSAAQLFIPDIEALHGLQTDKINDFDHDQPYLTLNLGQNPPSSIQAFINSRLTNHDHPALPHILPIQIQNIRPDHQAGGNTRVRVTEQIIVKEIQYQLTSAIVHDRHDAARPHHVAYVKTKSGWIKADDSQPKRVPSVSELMAELGQHGLLIQYTRIDAQAAH